MKRSDSVLRVAAEDPGYSAVEAVVGAISQRALAEASLRFGGGGGGGSGSRGGGGGEGAGGGGTSQHHQARALMHLESHLRRHPGELQSSLSVLQRIYSGLHQPDYVAGAAAVRTTVATMEERIALYRATGSFQDALGCYESLSDSDNPEKLCGMAECYLRLDRPYTAAALAKTAAAAAPSNRDSTANAEVRKRLRGYQVSLR